VSDHDIAVSSQALGPGDGPPPGGDTYETLGAFIGSHIPYKYVEVRNPDTVTGVVDPNAPEVPATTTPMPLPDDPGKIKAYGWLKAHSQPPGEPFDVAHGGPVDESKCEHVTLIGHPHQYRVTKVLRIPYWWRGEGDDPNKWRTSYLLVGFTGPDGG
jgi:hypothetical protein